MNEELPYVLSYDLGGTKLAAAIIDREGKILATDRELVDLDSGKQGVVTQMGQLGRRLLKDFPKVQLTGMASAGPLDPGAGVLLNPTNLVTDGREWGQVPIAELLGAELGMPVFLENDAAASVLAEYWVGEAKEFENVVILTLGTGLGVGVVSNGRLERAGRLLHPEAGHVSLNITDKTAPCGCGNFGCAEAYLSGRNFERRVALKWDEPTITGREISELARSGDARALAEFSDYAHYMAAAINNYVVLYAPEIVIFAGGFSGSADLFMSNTRAELEVFLKRRRVGVDLMPKLAVSNFRDEIGLLGAAYVAFNADIERF